jgi:cellulose synthase/poly-beta-1,6-N-acetylglucosamine synthase-like glycosyltransferase
VVCTYERLPELLDCLRSLDRQTLAKSRYEIIIVDNSAAGTARKAVSILQGDGHNLAYVHEPNPGLTAARNRGLSQAQGQYIAYIDDDAVADVDWLEQAIQIHRAHHGVVGFLGGCVRPVFETARPVWLTDDLLPFLSMTVLGDEPMDVTAAPGLVGTNMIFPTHALREVGGFAAELGRKAERLLSNEELHVQSLLESKGLQSIYDPRVGVSHQVANSRLTKQWFRRRLYWQGRSDALWWQRQNGGARTARANEAARAMSLIAKHAAHRLHLVQSRGSARSAFASECHLLSRLGYVVGMIRGNGTRLMQPRVPLQ